MTKITAFHERELRNKARTNEYMKYMNVNLSGLRGRSHPCLSGIITTEEEKRLRPFLKFLTGDYLTYPKKFDQTNLGSPSCRLCDQEEGETVCHILAVCPFYNGKRAKFIEEMKIVCQKITYFDFEDTIGDGSPEKLTQFILDPTSFNLKNRVNISDPIVPDLYSISIDLCNQYTQRG